jgi:hypothetical protein
MPKNKFGIPSKAPGPGSFPIGDKAHADAALRLLPKSVNAGNTSDAEAAQVRAMAQAELNGGGGGPGPGMPPPPKKPALPRASIAGAMAAQRYGA